jgi:hypothetical protein
MDWILSRLDEPSTYAGFAGMAAAIGISAPIYSAASAVAVAVFALISVLKREGKL